MSEETTYLDIIKQCQKKISKLQEKKESWNNDEIVCSLYQVLLTAYQKEIHSVLIPQKTDVAEKQIRAHIKSVILDVLRPLYVKIQRYSGAKGRKSPFFEKYLALYDDFYALAAFRSFKHFALYMEFDKTEEDKIWEHTMPCFEGYFYYACRAILDHDVRKLVKQLPTGYGKSYTDTIHIAWSHGVDIDRDSLKVVGNPSLVSDIMIGITNIMLSKRYAKVFPYYRQFDCDADKMFTICKIQQGELLIKGAKCRKSVFVCSKGARVDGGRYKDRYYDDITNSDDIDKIDPHKKDIDRYDRMWKKRTYDENDSFESFSGTTYAQYDFLSQIRERYGADSAIDSKFKWTKANPKTMAVFISVPKLDWDTDESTYPQRYSTEDARAERDRDFRTFMAMEQQSPLPPDGTPFYWDNLLTYTELPKKQSDGGIRSDYCRAAMDLPRTGKNRLSLNIYSPCGEVDYFIDALYQKKPLDAIMGDGRELLDHACDKIIQHNVVRLVVETNTNSTIASQLDTRLKKRGYTACVIEPIYSYENKEDRIYGQQSTILKRIRFPERKVFAESSDVGQSMRDLACYAYNGREDDGIDTHAMYSKKFLFNTGQRKDKVVILRRKTG